MAFGDKKLYIAHKILTKTDEFGNEISEYEKPKEYRFSYMPTSSQVDFQIYGTLINNMFSSYLPMRYLGEIKTGDVAYLIDGEIQNIDGLVDKDIENPYCPNANYRVKIVQPQNIRLKVIFEKKEIRNN